MEITTQNEWQHIALTALSNLRNHLEDSRLHTQAFTDAEACWREGKESGLETAVEMLEELIATHLPQQLNVSN
jgi:hypothetical protein